MTSWTSPGLIVALLVVAAGCSAPPSPSPSAEGVRRVVAEARGMTGPTCAVAIEVALRRRLDGVATSSISLSQQTIAVEFADGRRPFSPVTFRSAVDEAGVEVLSFQIDACGVIEDKEGQRWLIAGENRLLLEEGAVASVGQPVCVSGRLNDRAEPHRLAVTAVQPARH